MSTERRPFSARMLSRPRAAILLVLTLVLGVVSRRVPLGAHVWDKSLGDVLSPVFAYLVLAMAMPRARPRALALVSFAICFALELFQLTGVPAALGRRQGWVRWFLGTTFSWHDVACYLVGAVVIAAIAWRLSVPVGRAA